MLCAATAISVALASSLAAQQPPQMPPRTKEPSETRPRPSRRQRLGIDRIEHQFPDLAPTGAGIPVGHVEGDVGHYMPNLQRRSLLGVEFTGVSGRSNPNSHTTATAAVIYGSDGLAPGIRDVYCYASNHWMGPAYLRTGSADPPVQNDRRLFNHSWISTSGPDIAEVLRRIDYVIDTRDVIMVVGVNNGRDSPVPPLLASAYNVIAVGQWSGKSSGGFTTVEGAGRCKPDIVAPDSRTSFATAAVTAVVARLLETADRMHTKTPDARRSELIKAVLLTGAAKPARWEPQPDKPLDEHLGAGRVRFDLSYQVLTAGPAGPGRVRKRYGWHLDALSPHTEAEYLFDTSEPRGELSVTLVWHRRIDGQRGSDAATGHTYWIDTPRLADFNLRLIAIDDRGNESTAAESLSAIDNVEQIYLKRLPAGRYRLEVWRQDRLAESWDYALAWRIENRPITPDEQDGPPLQDEPPRLEQYAPQPVGNDAQQITNDQ